MSSHRLPDDFNRFLATSSNVIEDPGANGTFDLSACPMFGIATIASGTRKLPDNMPLGTKFFVYATGSVTITTQAAVTMASLTTGQIAEFTARTSTTWNVVIHSTSAATSVNTTLTTSYGFIPIPLTQWRETGTNDTLAVVPGAGLGAGGVLGTDSTPALEYVNGDTDSSLRILYAAAGAQPIVTQVMLPLDMDTTQPMYFKAAGIMGGTADAPVLSLDTYFRDYTGTVSAKIEDDTTAFSDTADIATATIAASDIPDVNEGVPQWATIEVTPGAHGTDSLAIYGTYIQYTKKLLSA